MLNHCLEPDKFVLRGAYLLTWPCQTVYTCRLA